MTYESKTNKPVRSLEQSAQYQANYLKYDLKEDLKEVLHPLSEAMVDVAKNIDLISKAMRVENDR